MAIRSRLFQAAVLYHPRTRISQGEEIVEPTQIIVEPKFVLAPDEAKARIIIGRDIPKEHIDKLDDLEIVCRPFVPV
jgi:hypothetical protein